MNWEEVLKNKEYSNMTSDELRSELKRYMDMRSIRDKAFMRSGPKSGYDETPYVVRQIDAIKGILGARGEYSSNKEIWAAKDWEHREQWNRKKRDQINRKKEKGD
tara:strand:- start:13 stop:327 length:315 start_codon:yes stop_codon:yes gene_type:complete